MIFCLRLEVHEQHLLKRRNIKAYNFYVFYHTLTLEVYGIIKAGYESDN
jgi:hypothetical protein